MLRGKLTSPPAHRDVQPWTGATGICQRICEAHIFDETFRVNGALNADLFVAGAMRSPSTSNLFE
jgi:hypothetical protein